MNYLAYSWVEQGRNLTEARAMLERAVALRPQDGHIVDSLGWALFRLGQWPRAVELLERAVELEPRNATINDHLGDAYWTTGREAEARFQWRRALGLDPEPEERARIERKLREGLPPGGAATPR
jgi:Flp pilus assembly protein TadD